VSGSPTERNQKLAAAFLPKFRENVMLGWAITFLLIALIAAFLGFGGVAIVSIELAKIVFFVAVALFLISAIIGLMRGRSPHTY
jgi:uncharacterized membrane protein YtjA (UPF0391 family)